MKKVYILLLSLLFLSCEKGLIKPNGEKIIGKWSLVKADEYIIHRVLRGNNFVDSIIYKPLLKNEVRYLNDDSYLNIDKIRLNDSWIFNDYNLNTNSGEYSYRYLNMTNYLQIDIGHITKRTFFVDNVSKSKLQLTSVQQVISATSKKYLVLFFSK